MPSISSPLDTDIFGYNMNNYSEITNSNDTFINTTIVPSRKYNYHNEEIFGWLVLSMFCAIPVFIIIINIIKSGTTICKYISRKIGSSKKYLVNHYFNSTTSEVNNYDETFTENNNYINNILTKIIDEECSICIDSYENNRTVYILECDHIFHSTCMDEWIKYNNRTICPLCRVESTTMKKITI